MAAGDVPAQALFCECERVSQALFARARARSSQTASCLASLECALCVRCSHQSKRIGFSSETRTTNHRVPQCPRQGRPPAPPGSPKRPALRWPRLGWATRSLAGRVARLAPFECQSVGPLPGSHQADLASATEPRHGAIPPNRAKSGVVRCSGFPPPESETIVYSSKRKTTNGPPPGRCFRASPPESRSIVSLFKEKDDEPSWPRQSRTSASVSPPGLSAVPARVGRQAIFASPRSCACSWSALSAVCAGWSAGPARVACQARFASVTVLRSLVKRLKPTAGAARVVCRPRQSNVPTRVQKHRLFWREGRRTIVAPPEPRVPPPGSSAGPAKFARQPRQPSSFGECQSCAVPVTVARQTSQPHRLGSTSAPGRSWAPPGSSAVPARVACQARFASARVVPRQGRPPSPPGSPAKLLLRVPERRSPARQGRSPAPPG